jgi:uncharacterized sulfatase
VPKYELYDMHKDEHCIANLADVESMKHVREGLHKRLMKELETTNDPRVSDDIVFERSPYTDAFRKAKKRKK